MNNQLLNESVEVARNCSATASGDLTNSHTFNFNMCSSMISRVTPHTQPAPPAKKTLKHLIMRTLKQLRTTKSSSKQTNSPTLHKFVYKSPFCVQTQTLPSHNHDTILAQHNSPNVTSRGNTIVRHTSHHNLSPHSHNNISDEEFETMPEACDLFPDSDLFLFNNSHEITHLFDTDPTEILQLAPSASNAAEISANISDAIHMAKRNQESTPIRQRSAVIQQIALEDSFARYEADMTMDESTQVAVDEPVLLESTFDTSSCSNLSGDLIVVRTGFSPKSSANSTSAYLSACSTEANTLLIECVPDWAMGNQLKLAIVNQVYFAGTQSNVFG